MTAATGAIQVILQTIVIVLSRLVVVRVTTRAGRLVTRRRPIDDFRVCAVAFRAKEVTSVIKRFIGESGMAEIRRRPGVRRMTNTTILSRAEMPGALACGISAVVA